MEILIFSMSEIESWKRCRKKFDLAALRGLEPHGKNEAMALGTDLHQILASVARKQYGGEPIYADPESPMWVVANEYLRHNPLPSDIVAAEEPTYTYVCDIKEWDAKECEVRVRRVFIRTTFDLIYKPNSLVVRGKDYKSFAQAPTLDVDLDFQGRIYTAVLRRAYPLSMRVDFEWDYIRREVGRELKGKGYVEWPIEDRYLNVPMVLSDMELETTWRELEETVRDMVRSIDENRLYRVDLKVGPHSCSMCSHNTLCKTEYAHGELSGTDIQLLATPTDPAERATKRSILTDPRVQAIQKVSWGAADQRLEPAVVTKIRELYGENGVKKVYADK